MIRFMHDPVDLTHLLHNNLSGGSLDGGDNEWEKWKFGPWKVLVYLTYCRKCLLLNLIIFKLVIRYLVLL